ncbi:MAG: hypothetical protein E7260_10980 [Lachnospiraceae bacterium]|nr:hypothetical protein [Lachnospiraceae bacterium]
MQEKYEVGSHVFIIESNRNVTEMVVVAQQGEFYTLKFLNGGAIKLRVGRVFETREKAEEKIPGHKKTKRGYRSPYDFGI